MGRRRASAAVAQQDTKANAITAMLAGYDPNNPDTVDTVASAIVAGLKLMYLQMNRVQEDFVRCKNRYGRTPRTRLFEAGNQSGKTTLGVAEDIAHMMGFRPWLPTTDPDYRIRIKVPNSGLVGCEVAGQNLVQRIEPQFMDFIPSYCWKGDPNIVRYSDGSIKSLTLDYDYMGNPCGSTANFRSYVQSTDSFEGVINDWAHFDEPPPQPIFNAVNRGRMSTNAPAWLTMTPLKEPYVYDVLSLHAYNNEGDDQDIAIFRCSVWENCQDYCRECNITIVENTPGNVEVGQPRPVNNCPRCGKVMGYMPYIGIANYLKTITDIDEREAREEGKWKHLSGMVYKELDRTTHIYDDFAIPPNWMRGESVDPHDARPTRWLFWAVSPEEIVVNGRHANRIYVYGYLLATGNIDTIAHSVRVKRAEYGYREPNMVILDAKFGTKTVKTADDMTTWEDELAKAGIKRIRLSHSAPGDVSLGHKMVKQYLAPYYSVLSNKTFPGMMLARTGCSGNRGPIQDMFNYRWREGSDKPEEDYKDMCDCVRYAAMEQPRYQPPVDSDEYTPQPKPPDYNPMYYGLVMR